MVVVPLGTAVQQITYKSRTHHHHLKEGERRTSKIDSRYSSSSWRSGAIVKVSQNCYLLLQLFSAHLSLPYCAYWNVQLLLRWEKDQKRRHTGLSWREKKVSSLLSLPLLLAVICRDCTFSVAVCRPLRSHRISDSIPFSVLSNYRPAWYQTFAIMWAHSFTATSLRQVFFSFFCDYVFLT